MAAATWSNISNATNAQVEVKVPPQAPIDLKPLCDVLDEGFKRWHMAHANEMADSLESVEKSVMELTNQMSAVGVGIMDLQKDVVGELTRISNRLASLGVSIDAAAKNVDMVEDNLPLLVHAIKGIKMEANIPITNLTVALPKFIVWYALSAPVIFALISLLISRVH